MTWTALGKTARFINGAVFKPTDWEPTGLPIIRIQNLTGTAERFNRTTRNVKPELLVAPGDLLVSWSATLDVFRWPGPIGVLNQHIFKVIPKPGIDQQYLFFALKNALTELSSKTHGSTMKHVVRGDFEATEINLPPLDEQRRIVGLLDRAAEIRRRADAARARARAIIPALFLDTFGDPATNPKGWSIARIGEVVKLTGGGTPSKANPGFWNGTIPWVSPKDMKPPTIFDSEDKITSAAMAASPAKLIPAGNVLIVVRGMILAHTVPIRMNAVAVTLNQDMKALEPIKQILPTFLRWALGSLHGYFLSKVLESAHGTKKLETEVLTSYPIVLPPMKLQAAFTDQAQRLESLACHLDAAAAKAEAMAAGLSAEVFGASPHKGNGHAGAQAGQ